MPLADGGKLDKGKYVPPSQRGGVMTMMDSRRSDENTLRIDNLPSHTEEKELRELILSSIAGGGPRVVGSRMTYAGRIQRLFVARNKQTGECKASIAVAV